MERTRTIHCLVARAGHRDSARPELWLGHLGPMTANGVTQLVYRRAQQAGLPGVHPHLFRHAFAHEWLALSVDGGQVCGCGRR